METDADPGSGSVSKPMRIQITAYNRQFIKLKKTQSFLQKNHVRWFYTCLFLFILNNSLQIKSILKHTVSYLCKNLFGRIKAFLYPASQIKNPVGYRIKEAGC